MTQRIFLIKCTDTPIEQYIHEPYSSIKFSSFKAFSLKTIVNKLSEECDTILIDSCLLPINNPKSIIESLRNIFDGNIIVVSTNSIPYFGAKLFREAGADDFILNTKLEREGADKVISRCRNNRSFNNLMKQAKKIMQKAQV